MCSMSLPTIWIALEGYSKEALRNFDGTVVLVSHDRDCLDGIVDRVYEFRDGGVREYLGGIYFLQQVGLYGRG